MTIIVTVNEKNIKHAKSGTEKWGSARMEVASAILILSV